MSFEVRSRATLNDDQLRTNLRLATTTIRDRRSAAVAEKSDWEALRNAGSQIKRRALAQLDVHLEALERAVTIAGGTVHWASDGAEANRVVVDITKSAQATRVLKAKSLTTDEIALNDALEAAGIEAIETDLAELIVQLAHDRPSHILVPAIHFNRHQIRALFERSLGLGALPDDPAGLASAARTYLRDRLLTMEVGITGVNFAVAETGTVCLVESEGNARMCATLPRVLVSVMGIEKVIPEWADLEVMLQLLPRSATGERMNPYTSLWTGTTAGDGPEEFHLVLLDGGRTRVLSDRVGREALKCIRCSACLNVCPVYERTGGHAYGSTYPGPIGAVLAPQLAGLNAHRDLPFASTLCGACYEVCPVKIDIPRLLVHLRSRIVGTRSGRVERTLMRTSAAILMRRRLYEATQRVGLRARRALPLLARFGVLRRWTESHELPDVPAKAFRETWRSDR